ncbi:tubulin-like doman-containing protein [Streptomyces sp. SAJ15]|uniref:tubulin-like doman-containing protein n=1 Tax=Streptomyces sp. SAJ15 TaxID=2011095 RepID=UPI0021B1F99F|nr:tubulin-like doman-containing protein [Streptomyces sp. SAJ15]
MKIYQPMLFVGLGGTGARIGAELERNLRRELCGPDGTALVDGGKRAAFQLPDCLQFVYADFSESELDRLPHLSARGPEAAAFSRTSRAVHNLLPAYDNSPEVTRMLRIALHEEVAGWLPPREGEPRVSPLHTGAGQLPTVGRAALFATMRSGAEQVLGPLRAAIDALSKSGGDLERLGGRQIRGYDVFVAFSVAGGTGAGIFYDFLHLIGHAFNAVNLNGAKIYPLVVMPSAFPAESGGGREAELNAARALVDLSHLVDDQNAADAAPDLGDVEQLGRIGVKYPHLAPVRLRTSTVQTAFLFSRTAGMRPEDLRRSITAMVTSLIGTDLGEESVRGRSRADDDAQSFAASFVNRGTIRSAPAATGIGLQGMSTSLAASMTVPVDELAEIVASRMLACAVRGLVEQARQGGETHRALVVKVFKESGLEEIWTREALEVALPDPLPRGVKAIGQALRDRVGDMEDQLAQLDRRLDRRVGEIAERFTPRRAVQALLQEHDPFRLERVLAGNPGDRDQVAAAGFAGMLDNRRNRPHAPEGVQPTPPPVPRISRGMAGLVPARWGDPDVEAALGEQDTWYRWSACRVWHDQWKEQESRWRPPADRVIKDVSALVRAFRDHEEEESGLFLERKKELYREDRTGVSYLLPPQHTLGAFYDDVMARLLQREGLADHQDEAALLARIVEPGHWLRALSAVQLSPRAAVKEVKAVLEQRIKRLFVETGVHQERPLLPSLGDLLAAAAGDAEAAATVDEKWQEQFRSQLAGMLPAGFTPDGTGKLKVLIVRPQTKATGSVDRFLEQTLLLPRDENRMSPEFRAVPTESITVVLFRSEMSLTEVSEVRQVLRLWGRARDKEGREDYLAWRQRTGYREAWLASTESDRQRILQRMLCAMWNGQVEVVGDPLSPDRVRFRLRRGDDARDAVTMTLALEPYDRSVTSWSDLLRAYERWALLDAGTATKDFCGVLMETLPEGLSTSPSEPHPLLRTFLDRVAPDAAGQLDVLARRLDEDGREWIPPLRDFWTVTLDGALDLRFPRGLRANRATLRSLVEAVSARDHEDEHEGGPGGPGTGSGGGGGGRPDGRLNGHRAGTGSRAGGGGGWGAADADADADDADGSWGSPAYGARGSAGPSGRPIRSDRSAADGGRRADHAAGRWAGDRGAGDRAADDRDIAGRRPGGRADGARPPRHGSTRGRPSHDREVGDRYGEGRRAGDGAAGGRLRTSGDRARGGRPADDRVTDDRYDDGFADDGFADDGFADDGFADDRAPGDRRTGDGLGAVADGAAADGRGPDGRVAEDAPLDGRGERGWAEASSHRATGEGGGRGGGWDFGDGSSDDRLSDDPYAEDPYAEEPYAERRHAQDRSPQDRSPQDRYANDHGVGDRVVGDRAVRDRAVSDRAAGDADVRPGADDGAWDDPWDDETRREGRR